MEACPFQGYIRRFCHGYSLTMSSNAVCGLLLSVIVLDNTYSSIEAKLVLAIAIQDGNSTHGIDYPRYTCHKTAVFDG